MNVMEEMGKLNINILGVVNMLREAANFCKINEHITQEPQIKMKQVL